VSSWGALDKPSRDAFNADLQIGLAREIKNAKTLDIIFI
jgi:hypothetical protein